MGWCLTNGIRWVVFRLAAFLHLFVPRDDKELEACASELNCHVKLNPRPLWTRYSLGFFSVWLIVQTSLIAVLQSILAQDGGKVSCHDEERRCH